MGEQGGRVVALRMVVRPARLRVVLDTNLFVAAYWNPRSAPARVLSACEENQLQLLYSAAIRREMDHILRKAHTSEAFRHRVSLLLEDAEEVCPTRTLHLVQDDPEDDKFLECALEGDADYLISSDAHLLRLGPIDGACIIKPGAFARAHLM
ncbi:MAG TPA: putative toxin-antitoxin system toxin component, PIN family [Armatimonadota bacterium]|mgnify:FL=1|nr:putative toxin-antitoxin system toxin component, PIN family [Armatimonadota bacterium]HOJ20388.1 putative toxin-antitoxin system toxin component, PIN family [Armatimonadota bacterium]HOM81174.1 putative toxin-antitoxin system toxin component, PIN family [Armatimonadota bacterium]HOQ27143.1 putative toxin-antitoxin system toxin component, PIN family [Armatimonadota bacterium]HPO73510.1 putative toxin-antitoxin system toxin component, PIN family [Armatimonadota bacterium]